MRTYKRPICLFKELREEFEAIVTKTKQTRDRVDSVRQRRAKIREQSRYLKDQLERLSPKKMTDMEDRSRRNNVRLVDFPEGMEGPDAAGFLRANLSTWIPSLRGRDIEIDRAHRVYDGGRGLRSAAHSHLPCVYWDGMTDQISWKVLGRRIRMKCAQNNVTLLFFPDFSPATAIRRKAFGPVLKKRWQHLVSSPSSLSSGWLSYGTKENREASIPLRSGGFYQLHVSAEVLCRSSAGGRRGSSGRCFSSSTGGAWWPGWTWP